MKTMIKTVAAAGALLLLVSCGKDDTEPAPAPKLTISPAPETITFGSNAEESYRFEVTANDPEWQAVSDQPWCKVEMDAKAGTFTVTAEENYETTAPAPATITVTAGKAVPLTLTATQAEAQYDVYIAGGSSTHKVCYWKNGQLIPLELPDQTKQAICYTMCISDNSVYIGGSYNSIGCYWKDGKIYIYRQPEGVVDARCEAIAVSDGKVYGAGRMTKDGMTFLTCWTNAFLYQIDPNPERDSYCTGIVLSDGTIHLAGNFEVNHETTAFYLKLKDFQEDPVPLELLPGCRASCATDIAMSDGKVYITGYCYFDYKAGYWLDGVFMPIEDPNLGSFSSADAIAIQNGTVHIAGTHTSERNKYAYYWNKEQGSTLLSQPVGSTDEMMMRNIAVFGDKVFISGSYYMDRDNKACYWINGERVDLEDPNGGYTYCTAMTVVKR